MRRELVIMHHEDDREHHRARVEAAGVRLAVPSRVYDLVLGQRVA
ncbi:hypothetical protein [Nannocystis bainbridge]|uniref:Uncharacterized protein n=1 Tax=Nannocystis bainbridge TaxID=2995303 RepID=A0ABT5EDA4_9BACT|nr:hypothetical protein [Nannocystis bainbridge]MDC0722822.1 hypothetical protein [Nannocystis bainbridge]